MARTKIEWAEAVWNPTIGCRRVSEGCRNCYAERVAARLVAMGRREYEDVLKLKPARNPFDAQSVWNGSVKLLEERVRQPLNWKKPRRIFVDSMSDLFHEDVPFEFIDEVFAVMGRSQQHTFMILTKRPERMYEYFQEPARYQRILNWAYKIDSRLLTSNAQIGSGIADLRRFPWINVWFGISAENQREWDARKDFLYKTPAAVRFVSIEPMLGEIDLDLEGCMNCLGGGEVAGNYFAEDGLETCPNCLGRGHTLPWLDWVICGGESGPNARPMHPDWARSLRDQCREAGVAYFFKQWGEFVEVSMEEADATREGKNLGVPPRVVMFGPAGSTVYMKRVGKHAAGNLLDGKKWEEYPDGR